MIPSIRNLDVAPVPLTMLFSPCLNHLLRLMETLI